MGLLGSTFTAQAQDAVRRAQDATSKISKGMDNAHLLTKQTAQTYRETEQRTKQSFEKIHPDAKTQTPKGDATKPSSTSKPATPAKADPPTPPKGGDNNPPPHDKTPADTNRPPSWIDTARKNFTPKEFQDFQTALRKMSEDPIPGEVPGSGRLNAHERDLVARAQSWVEITSDTTMQKALAPGLADKMIRGEAGPATHSVGGCFARVQDAGHMRTPGEFYTGLRLDFPDSPFTGKDPVQVIEFPAGDQKHYETPFGAPAHNPGLPSDSPKVIEASNRMQESVEAVPQQSVPMFKQWN